MFAGHDTVSSATTFALYLIGRHPEVQHKLHEELNQVFGSDRDRPVTPDDIQRLEYLSCVVKESLRLLPSAPLLGREIEEDVNMCGTTIPKGTTVFIGIFWLHRDPKQFPDPEKFDPDRFLSHNMKGRHNFAFIPFSAGHRNCIGQKFALMEEKVILATILRKLNVTSLQSISELGLTYELVLRSTEGIKVKLSIR
ncbi:Cytochrome P450 4V2 [Holothuria leucospilota]|uniref:Cytochrome P450 4V2 n=1 Tax=Holothuria leucospilota TaxID=206669 RepID=A0A9Q1BC49_HOLLE|nr:Cytochrome P450 4V2 [Holothuria leucospilota]